MAYPHMEFYSAVTRSAVLTHATTRVVLEDRLLRARNQMQKATHSRIPVEKPEHANPQREKLRCGCQVLKRGGKVRDC